MIQAAQQPCCCRAVHHRCSLAEPPPRSCSSWLPDNSAARIYMLSTLNACLCTVRHQFSAQQHQSLLSLSQVQIKELIMHDTASSHQSQLCCTLPALSNRGNALHYAQPYGPMSMAALPSPGVAFHAAINFATPCSPSRAILSVPSSCRHTANQCFALAASPSHVALRCRAPWGHAFSAAITAAASLAACHLSPRRHAAVCAACALLQWGPAGSPCGGTQCLPQSGAPAASGCARRCPAPPESTCASPAAAEEQGEQ